MARKQATGTARLGTRVRGGANGGGRSGGQVGPSPRTPAGGAPEGLETRRVREIRGVLRGAGRASPRRPAGELGRSLREVNKLIFVQDFERASRLLRRLSEAHPADYEVQFRRIEVACRTDEIEDVCHEYTTRALRHPQVLALQLAATLAEIRYLERTAEEEEEGGELVNPSLTVARKDVTGLSADAERGGATGLVAGGLSQRARAVYASLGSGGGSLRAQSPSSGGTLVRIARTPSWADDAVPQDVPALPDAFADDVAALTGEKGSERQATPCVVKARSLLASNESEYAAWYVAGCAAEYAGELSRAVESWLKALALKPSSVAVLSTLSELQQIGALSNEADDYTQRFEELDKFLVHGSYETHLELYKEYLARGEHLLAIAALRTLADWIQRQRGEVPPEIEAVSLLGAMKAYRLAGNLAAAEACRREAENIVIAAKKGGESPSQLAFMGQVAEEHGLTALARICYFAVLTSPETGRDLAIRTAAHCVSAMPGHALGEVLQTTYQIHRGHAEIRFCMLLNALGVGSVPIKRYMERRAKARSLLASGEPVQAAALLAECLREVDDDPETHMLMGEALWRQGLREQASSHYARMYWLDSLNSESALRFVSHLVRLGEFGRADQVAQQAMVIPSLTSRQVAELHWVRATALDQAGHVEDARLQMNKALAADPWNAGYLALALRLLAPGESAGLPHEDLLARYEDWIDSRAKEFPADLTVRWVVRTRAALRAGYVEYAWTMARALFPTQWKDAEVAALYATAGAAWNSRGAAQQTLLLLQKPQEAVGFAAAATVIARVYGMAGEWPLVEEWIDIAERSGLDDTHLRLRVFELQALALAIRGVDFRRAQSLVEAAIDVYEATSKVPSETAVLHGYLMLAQGDIKAGLEKMRAQVKDTVPSIQSLYFLVKGLQRAGRLGEGGKEHLDSLYALAPVNSLEQRLVEEIFMAVGLKRGGAASLTN